MTGAWPKYILYYSLHDFNDSNSLYMYALIMAISNGTFRRKFILIQFWSVWKNNWIYYLRKMVYSMFQPLAYFRLDFPAYILNQSYWLLINAVACEMRCSNFVFVRHLWFSSCICWHFIGWDRKFSHFCLCRFGVLCIILRSIIIW